MHWLPPVRQNDPRACALADRHYSRQTPGSKRFMPPARQTILLTPDADALWGTSWPFPEMAMHGRGDCWVCSIFRNESLVLSSTLIMEAIAVTRWKYGVVPEGGVLTFVNTEKIRRKRDPGRCFRKCGFEPEGYTQRGLLVLRLASDKIPFPAAPLGALLIA